MKDLCCQTRPLPALSRREAAKNELPRHNATELRVCEMRVSRPRFCEAERVNSRSKHPLFGSEHKKRGRDKTTVFWSESDSDRENCEIVRGGCCCSCCAELQFPVNDCVSKSLKYNT